MHCYYARTYAYVGKSPIGGRRVTHSPFQTHWTMISERSTSRRGTIKRAARRCRSSRSMANRSRTRFLACHMHIQVGTRVSSNISRCAIRRLNSPCTGSNSSDSSIVRDQIMRPGEEEQQRDLTMTGGTFKEGRLWRLDLSRRRFAWRFDSARS